MTTDELNAIVQAVMLELEKAGVDFDFKAETPQPTDLVYVMRGTADKYQGITVKWQNLLDLIVKNATDAKNEAVSAKDIALQTLATIQGIESNVSTMKSSVDASEANVASMKASVETSEANVTQMKSDVSTMKTSVENTKTEVENIKEETAGLIDTKVDYSDSLTYEQIMATTDLTNKVASAGALKTYSNNMADRFQQLYSLPYFSYQSMGGSTDNETYFKAWISHIFNNYKYVLGNPIVAKVNPNSDGICIGLIYNSPSLDYASFMYIPVNASSALQRFGYINSNWFFVENN